MSKKTRKKSPKTSRKSSTSKQASVRSPKATKARTAKTGATKAAKSKKAAVPSRKQGSQTAPSKPLKQSPSGPAALAGGTRAPAFRLPRDGGASVSLADFAGQKLVLFFYPRADTPGCTKEAIDFTRLKGEFAAAGTSVLGVSADPVKAQETFRDKHQLAVPLISDERHVRGKLARGETVYLAGLGLPGTHNAGVSLVEVTQANGPRLILNNEEERFSGNKHTTEYPVKSIDAMVAALRGMVTTASAPTAASAGEAAQCAPRAIRSSAFALLRFQTATAKPASR